MKFQNSRHRQSRISPFQKIDERLKAKKAKGKNAEYSHIQTVKKILSKHSTQKKSK